MTYDLMLLTISGFSAYFYHLLNLKKKKKTHMCKNIFDFGNDL